MSETDAQLPDYMGGKRQGHGQWLNKLFQRNCVKLRFCCGDQIGFTHIGYTEVTLRCTGVERYSPQRYATWRVKG